VFLIIDLRFSTVDVYTSLPSEASYNHLRQLRPAVRLLSVHVA